MSNKLPRLVNKDSLALYRDILRASNIFTWTNEQGEQWKYILRSNARKEFEQARYERDPEVVARLLLVGRDCLNQTMWSIEDKQNKLRDDIDKTRSN